MLQELLPGLIWIHLLSTWFMVGLVCFVQWVHYPLLADLPPEAVPKYQLAHMRRANPLIPLVMLTEAISAFLIFPENGKALAIWIVNLTGLFMVWVPTFVWIIPLHEKLAMAYGVENHKKLLRWNLFRTFAWLLHGICAVFLLKALSS